ncbi:MAG: DUF1570 domain-containing protein [Planctomycetota bacterium]
MGKTDGGRLYPISQHTRWPDTISTDDSLNSQSNAIEFFARLRPAHGTRFAARMVPATLALFFLSTGGLSPLSAEKVRFRADTNGVGSPGERSVDGEVLVEAADGGLMIRGDDGRIWTVQPDQLLERSEAPIPAPLDQKALVRRMVDELGGQYQAFVTAHYIVLHQGNEAYVRDVATLLESLYRSFFSYWKNQSFALHKPTFPLVALVLPDRSRYLAHANKEIGDTAQSLIGYYHLGTNRVTTFRMPDLERNVATLIHEATHQLAYNCGLQTRFADNPMWVSEGLALYFESPDLSNPKLWRGIGRVNPVNLHRFRTSLPNRASDSLATLISDDRRFRSEATALSAYGEAWALTYFLIRTRRRDYLSYLAKLSEGKPLGVTSPRDRIAIFEEMMGMSLAQLDTQFLRYMRRVR